MGATVLRQRSDARIGVVGLGTGALAGLLGPSQELVYHEIDPLVADLAREYFTYLTETRGSVRIILGDGRRTLEAVADGSYDLLIVDAYSSGFVPTHLLTVEAMELYRAKVRPDGLVMLHISNRYVDLRRVVHGYSLATGAAVAYAAHTPTEDAIRDGALPSRVAVIAPSHDALDTLLDPSAWQARIPGLDPVVWTDARIDIPAVLGGSAGPW